MFKYGHHKSKLIPIYVFSVIIFILLIYGCSKSPAPENSKWERVSKGIGNQSVTSLAVKGNFIFAGTQAHGVYVSSNNGEEWTTQITLNTQNVLALTVSGNNIFAGTYGEGVFVSKDNGFSWKQTSVNNKNVKCLASNGDNVFAGVMGMDNYNGIYLLTNNGANWIQIFSDHTDLEVFSLAVKENNVFAGTVNGVYLSTDNGANWTQSSLGNMILVFSLAINGNNIFAGTSDNHYGGYGVYLSSNNGTSWAPTSLNNQDVRSITAIGKSIFAGTYDSGVYVSSNNGVSWTQKGELFDTDQEVISFCMVNDYIFAAARENYLITLSRTPRKGSVYRRRIEELIR